MPKVIDLTDFGFLMATGLSSCLESRKDGHVEWTGARDEFGAPQYRYEGIYYHPHRVIYSNHINQAVPETAYVRITCGYKCCMNPEHMEMCNHSFDKVSAVRTPEAAHVWPEKKPQPLPPSLCGFVAKPRKPKPFANMLFPKRRGL